MRTLFLAVLAHNLEAARVRVGVEEAAFQETRTGRKGICEDQGIYLPDEIRKDLDRPLTADEETSSYKQAGLLLDKPVKPTGTPTAYWILGPSGVGKSFSRKAYRLRGDSEDPVTLDGDYFRFAHGGYKAALYDGLYHHSEDPTAGCTFAEAWETIKPYRAAWRSKLWRKALEAKRNLVVVEVCTDWRACLAKMNETKALGYKNNIVAIIANQSVTEQRGVDRQLLTGKRYQTTFKNSVEAFVPMIATSNGWYQLLDNTKEASAKILFECETYNRCPQHPIVISEGLKLPTYPGWTQTDGHRIDKVVQEVTKFVGAIEKNQQGGPHLPTCEDLGLDLPTSLARRVNRVYTKAELDKARNLLHLKRATPSQKKPLALWVLGPPGVGKTKSIKVSDLPERMGFTKFPDGAWDAVLVDGEVYREVSKAFEEVVDDGRSRDPPCVWRFGWGGRPKRDSKEEKKKIFAEAMKARKNLIIPTTCASGFDECMRKIDELKKAGYTNHVLMVYAKSSLVLTRGMARADFTGKSYEVLTWQSVHGFTPMVAAANGQYEFIDNNGAPKVRPSLKGDGHDMPLECAKSMKKSNVYVAGSPDLEAKCGGKEAIPRLQALQKNILDHVWAIEKNVLLKDHLPLCETLGVKAPREAVDKMNRDVTAEEYAEAEHIAGVHLATKGNKKPIALWLLGPSAVGKSTAAKGALEEYGMPKMKDPKTGKIRADAVELDGEIFRSVHRGFKDLVNLGLMNEVPCIWEKGWKGTNARTQSKSFKMKMYKQAVKDRQNLIIPSPCSSDLKGCLERVNELKAKGYVNHMVSIYARKALVDERGLSRADKDGKMYVTTVDDSIAAYAPMIALGNGMYELVDNSGKTRRVTERQPCLNVSLAQATLVQLEAFARKFFEPYKDVAEDTNNAFVPSEND